MNQTKTKKAKNGTKKSTSTTQSSLSLWISHLSKSVLIALVSGMILLLSATAAAYFTPNPSDWIPTLGLIVSALTALICGFAAAKLHGHSALLCGLYSGTLCMLLMLLASLFFKSYSTGYTAWLSCLLHAGFVLCAIGGAYIGARPPKRRKKRH
ncbi:MAG: TIGR04086 family membrane protein [Clostridia bacterium]|nr:TIGR04086 family membrane protein [Clostridia bacterium]